RGGCRRACPGTGGGVGERWTGAHRCPDGERSSPDTWTLEHQRHLPRRLLTDSENSAAGASPSARPALEGTLRTVRGQHEDVLLAQRNRSSRERTLARPVSLVG